MSVPNQRIVHIRKAKLHNKDNLFTVINLDGLQKAVELLNGSGLKMWCYCNKNQDKYVFDLSQVACQEYGIKKDSYYNGIKELIQYGFLIPEREGSNIFYFYETPHKNISEDKNWFSETTIVEVESPKKESENTERNNTNNTLQYINKKENEIMEKEKEAKKRFQELEDLYPALNKKQQRLFLGLKNNLDSFPVSGITDFDRKRRIEIINTIYDKIYSEEVS